MIQLAAKFSDEQIRENAMRWALTSQHRSRIEAMGKLAQSDESIVVEAKSLDADPMLLGVENGVVDLKTGAFRQARREDLIKKSAGVAFNPDAKAPKFEKFLGEITGGDRELMAYLPTLVGYFFTGITKEQQIYIPFGSGANGKTVMFETIQRLMGDYAKTVSPEAFMNQQNRGGATPELASLQGTRLVLASEPEDGATLSEGLVKRITGQDTITARGLYQSHVQYTPQFKVVMITNHKPTIKGTGNSIWRRICLIPFDQTFRKDQQNQNLMNELKSELPGILNWALAGLKAYLSDGLCTPAHLERLVDQYKSDMDVFGDWIEDCLIVGETCEATVTDLYSSYQEWCGCCGIRPFSKKKMSLKLEERGYQKARTTSARKFEGIAVKIKAASVPQPFVPKIAK